MGDLGQRRDSELLHSFCRNGEQAAFTQLGERHHPMIYRTGLRLLGNKEDACHALQADLITFAKPSTREALSQQLFCRDSY